MLGVMLEPRSKSKRSVIPAMVASAALVFLVGCKPDKDVTASPEYNFSSLAGTVWKTKTKSAIAGINGYSGGPKFFLLPPAEFDPTDTNYMGAPAVKSIAVLPPGIRLHITRLLQGQGQNGGYGVEAVVEDGSNAPKTVYVDYHFLFADPRWASHTNWGVNPDMLAPSGDSSLSASSAPEIGDTPQAGYKKGCTNGKTAAILANNALPQNKKAAVRDLSDPWSGLESRPMAVMIYGEDYAAEYESGYRKGFHDYFEEK